MDKKTVLHTISLFLPALIVAAACTFGLTSHSSDIIRSDAATVAPESEASGLVSDFVASQVETTEFEYAESSQSPLQSDESKVNDRIEQNSKLQSDNEQSSGTSTVSQISDKKQGSTPHSSGQSSSVTSKTESSIVSGDKTAQESKSPETSSAVSLQTSEVSAVKSSSVQTSKMSDDTQQTSRQTFAQESSKPAQTSKASQEQRQQVSAQPSQIQRDESKTEISKPTESSRQETSVAPQQSEQQSSEPLVSSEPSVVSEAPTGGYTDGTYKSTAEVDGFDVEGFLYDLEVTVTVSGGEITAISGKIKNDRSEDPSSNEAYVRRSVKKLSDVIIANQSTEGVDVISNATYSSNAVLKAVSAAIAQAER